MFSKATLIALAAATVSVDALQLLQPQNVHAATPLDVAWNFGDNDPPLFTLELAHPSFRQDFALANNLDPASGGVTVIMPALDTTCSDAQYVIRAVNVSNINQEYARTGPFQVDQAVSSTSSGSATTTFSSATNPPSGVSTTQSSTSGSNSASQSNTNTNTNTRSTTSGTSNSNPTTPTNTPQNGGGNGAASVGISFGAIAAGVFAAVGLF
ncbi:hypothetical protein AAF712_008071 [Marasmius tenuissimus]|uniref:Uncharacterized protein n=1 Tax=Marasmius tenuissimus TaxID=585030 RepID=A0ABR2ZV56_9AGAR